MNRCHAYIHTCVNAAYEWMATFAIETSDDRNKAHATIATNFGVALSNSLSWAASGSLYLANHALAMLSNMQSRCESHPTTSHQGPSDVSPPNLKELRGLDETKGGDTKSLADPLSGESSMGRISRFVVESSMQTQRRFH